MWGSKSSRIKSATVQHRSCICWSWCLSVLLQPGYSSSGGAIQNQAFLSHCNGLCSGATCKRAFSSPAVSLSHSPTHTHTISLIDFARKELEPASVRSSAHALLSHWHRHRERYRQRWGRTKMPTFFSVSLCLCVSPSLSLCLVPLFFHSFWRFVSIFPVSLFSLSVCGSRSFSSAQQQQEREREKEREKSRKERWKNKGGAGSILFFSPPHVTVCVPLTVCLCFALRVQLGLPSFQTKRRERERAHERSKL